MYFLSTVNYQLKNSEELIKKIHIIDLIIKKIHIIDLIPGNFDTYVILIILLMSKQKYDIMNSY